MFEGILCERQQQLNSNGNDHIFCIAYYWKRIGDLQVIYKMSDDYDDNRIDPDFNKVYDSHESNGNKKGIFLYIGEYNSPMISRTM